MRERQRIPPPREEQRWERDRYDGNERGYNYDHRGSHQAGPSSLLRFPSPHEHYPSAHHRQPYHPDNEGRRPSYRNTRSDGNDTGSSYDLPQKPRKRIATPPNQSVILIGIPVPAAEEDVKSFIDEFRSDPSDPSPVENVVIVRDKATGQSKRFGFVRFISLEHARGMPNTPKERLPALILVGLQHSWKPISIMFSGDLEVRTTLPRKGQKCGWTTQLSTSGLERTSHSHAI